MPTIYRYTPFLSTRPRGARHAYSPPSFDPFAVSIHAPAWGATNQAREQFLRRGFLSTRPRGARRHWTACSRDRGCFYPRARVGRDWASESIASAEYMFLSTRPRGARPCRHATVFARGRFYPRARVGRDPRCPRTSPRTDCFYPRARVGRDRKREHRKRRIHVSIHAPAWGATASDSNPSAEYMFLSTRPRGARPAVRRRGRQRHPVSIHAPAWGATVRGRATGVARQRFYPRARVGRDGPVAMNVPPSNWFLSTRPRGARRDGETQGGVMLGFLSTRPRGARRSDRRPRRPRPVVSIHAPAWGATFARTCMPPKVSVSIHAPAWGATLSSSRSISALLCFYPRARVGRDDWALEMRGMLRVSIHAPAWGATQLRTIGSPTIVSIHAPAWGATGAGEHPGDRPGVSIHAPAWGATDGMTYSDDEEGVSIHAPAWGATGIARIAPLVKISFYPRARVGRDRLGDDIDHAFAE